MSSVSCFSPAIQDNHLLPTCTTRGPASSTLRCKRVRGPGQLKRCKGGSCWADTNLACAVRVPRRVRRSSVQFVRCPVVLHLYCACSMRCSTGLCVRSRVCMPERGRVEHKGKRRVRPSSKASAHTLARAALVTDSPAPACRAAVGVGASVSLLAHIQSVMQARKGRTGEVQDTARVPFESWSWTCAARGQRPRNQ